MSSTHFATINPATDEQIEKFAYFTSQEKEAVIARADKAFKSYGHLRHSREQSCFPGCDRQSRRLPTYVDCKDYLTVTIAGRQFEQIAQEVPLPMTKSPPQRARRDESLRV